MQTIIRTKKVNPVVISQEELDYYHRALEYAIKKGFKIKLFSEKGKVIALQG